MNSSQESPNDLFFNAITANKPGPIHITNSMEMGNSNLLVDNLTGSVQNSKPLVASIISPDNPLKHILNQSMDNQSVLSLGVSPQIQNQDKFKFQGLTLHKADASHNFEDSIDLKSKDSPTINKLPVLQEKQQTTILTGLDLGPQVKVADSAQLKNSEFLMQSGKFEGNMLKVSGFLMQSPQLQELEKYIVNENQKDINNMNQNKSPSRPSSDDPLVDKQSPGKSPMKKSVSSPLKKWHKKFEEERIALIDAMLKDEEEKKEADQGYKQNDEMINSYERKIEEEIKSGTLRKQKTLEKENHIVSFKRVYHRLFVFSGFLKNLYRKYLLINLILDKCFSKCCACFKGRLYVSKYVFVIAFFYSIIMIGYILGTNDAEYKTRSKTVHPLKKYMAANLLKAALITTYYGVFFVQIRYYILIVLMFFVQFIPCLILLLKVSMEFFVYKSIYDLPPESYLPEIFMASLYLFWLLVFFVKEDVKRNFSEAKDIYILIIWFVFGGSIFAGVTCYQIATSKVINIQWYHNYVSTLCVPYVIFICINWVYLHVRFIVPIIKRYRKRTRIAINAQDQQQNSTKIKKSVFSRVFGKKETNIERNNTRALTSKKSFRDFLNVSENLKKMQNEHSKDNLFKKMVIFFEHILTRFSRFLISIASFSIFGAMISTTIYCIFYIIYESNEYTLDESYPLNNDGVLCCSFLVLLIPITFLIGIPLISSSINLKNKLFLFPIFGLAIPICITLPIANAIQIYSEYQTFVSYLIFGPPCFSIFWLFLIYMSQHGRRILYFVTTFFCLFFVVPLGFLSPLINAQGFLNSDGAKAAMIILLCIGSSVLFIYFLYLFLRRFGKSYLMTKDELAKQPKFEFMNYFRLDCENFGLFGNGVGFIITLTILIFGIFNKPDYIRPAQEGSLSGLIIVVCLLFIFLTMIIRMPVVNPAKVYSHSINDQFEKEFQPERVSAVKQQGFVRLGVLLFGFVIMPIIFIPIIIVNRDNTDTKYLLLTALIGNALIIMIFMMFYSIKKNYEEFGKSLVPAFSIFCWFFVFVPFAAIIPITVVNLRMEEDVAQLYQITEGVAALIIFLGVGILAIIGNLFFKRIEYEKKFKFIAGKVIKMLKKLHVRSDYDVIRLAYEDYLTKGPNKSEDDMKKAKPIYYVKSSKYNPQIEYSKILISESNFKKLRKRQNMTKEQLEKELKMKDKKKKKCLRALVDACCPFEELGHRMDEMNKTSHLKTEESENNGGNYEAEEEVLSEGSEEDHIYKSKKSIIPEKKHEKDLGEAFNDIIVNNFMKSNEEADKEDLAPEVQNLKNLKVRDLDPRIWNALKFYDFTDNLGVNEKAQFDLLKIVFKMFAYGDRRRVTMPWIDYVCYKELLRIARIIPCDEIPDFMIDLTYTQFTTKDTTEFCNPILEFNFKEILARIAVLKFPDDLKEDAYNKLLRYYIFPLILWNMPEMQQQYPHEWDYVLYLMGLYGLNENYADSKNYLQRKQENENLLKQMGGMMLLEKEEEEANRQREEAEKLKQLELESQLAIAAEKKRLEEELRKKKLEQEEERIKAEAKEKEEMRKMQEEKDRLQKLEKERKEREKRRILKYWLCLKISELCVFFFQSFCLIQTRGVLEEDQEDEDRGDEADFHYAVDALIAISNKKKAYTHLESPPWENVVHSMVDYFPLAEEEYSKKKLREESLHMQRNFTNFMAILSKILEMFSMGSIALRSQIDWELSENAQYGLNALNNNIPITENFPKYKFFFWFSFGISVFYWFAGYRAVKNIQKGTFGLVSSSKKFFNKDFLFTVFINIASSSFYMIIMKSFLDTFSCNYSVKPWTLYEDPSILCNTDTHYFYIFFAALGIILYYPLSSFLFPNIQFQNKSLDLKYDPTFIVILTQIKLLISGTASFFPEGSGLIIQLTTSTIAILFVAFLDKIMKPCLVKKHNILEVGGYLCAAWMCFAGLINVVTGDIFAATVIIIVGPICTVLITILFYIRHLRKMKKLREERKKMKLELGPNYNPTDEDLSPSGKSPLSSVSNKSKGKEKFDFSKNNNEFANFSLGNSPSYANNRLTEKDKVEFKIQMNQLQNQEEKGGKNTENENKQEDEGKNTEKENMIKKEDEDDKEEEKQ